MENYSGFLDHTDEQVGRLISAIEKSGQMENTLVFYIVGDNGASGEGGLEGTVNEVASLNGIQLRVDGVARQVRRDRRADDRAARAGRLGLGGRHAVPVDEAGGLALRRHAQRPHHSWPTRHQGQGRAALAVPSRHRRRADSARSCRHPRATGRRRGDAEADRGRQHALLLRRRRRPHAAQSSTSRCSATAASTRTAGWPRPATAGCRGKPRAVAAGSTRTGGSSTT